MHKKIGIIGGMSPESTVEYYQYITHTYTERFGDYDYPEVLIYSVSFQSYVDWPNLGRWDLVGKGLAEAAQKLEAAGADFVVIATNTMHIVLEDVKAAVSIPVLSLLDTIADAIIARKLKTVGLLGTRFTMEHELYPSSLKARGIDVLVPDADAREIVNTVIYNELVKGIIRDESRSQYVKVIDDLVERGAEGIILGCTEIPLLITGDNVAVPLFDTTTIHAETALNYAIDQ
jgi:aspartate racemase